MGNRLDSLANQFMFRDMIRKILESLPHPIFPSSLTKQAGCHHKAKRTLLPGISKSHLRLSHWDKRAIGTSSKRKF